MWSDLALGVRALRRSPLFTAAAVLSLALGIGANTAIFSLLNQVVLQSLPVPRAEQLVTVHGEYSGPGNRSSSWSTNSESVFPYPFYRDLRDRAPAFSGMIASALTPVRLTWKSETVAGDAQIVSGNYFAALGVPSALGRVLNPADDGAPGANPVAVLSHTFWRSKLGADAAVVGRTISINGNPFVIAGVAQAGFRGMVQGEAPEVFVPISMTAQAAPAMAPIEDRTFSWLNIFARLKPGESQAHAQAALNVVFSAIKEADRGQTPAPQRLDSDGNAASRNRLELRPAARGVADLREKWEKPLTVLSVMVGLVLLIACANVAGLLVARAAGRQREIAIRLALGAGRATLVRQLFAEGLILALAGAAAGLLLERWSTSALLGMLPRNATGDWVAAAIDLRLLGYCLGVSVLCAVLFALAPALRATRPDTSAALKNQARSVVSAGYSAAFRRALVTAQVALSFLLVAGAGLFTVSASKLTGADRGFHSAGLSMFNVDATLIRTGGVAATAFYHDLIERLSALPGQTGVAASDSGPYSNSGFGSGIRVEGYRKNGKDAGGAAIESVSPGYLHVLGIPLRAGREFTDRDTAAAPKAVVVNEAFVKKFCSGQNPIGKRVSFGGPTLDREIVGVAADVRTNVRRDVEPRIVYPYAQREQPVGMAFYVRTAGGSTSAFEAIRRAVRAADAGLPAPEIQPLETRIADSLYTSRLVAALSAVFGGLATLLAAVGLYGVIAFAVARRTGEIGLRMALGAMPANVLRMVLADASRMVLPGIVIGAAASFALGRYVESQLFGIKPADPAVYAGAAFVLAAVAALAAYWPARKAARIDPITALRYE
jgi:predicted permease